MFTIRDVPMLPKLVYLNGSFIIVSNLCLLFRSSLPFQLRDILVDLREDVLHHHRVKHLLDLLDLLSTLVKPQKQGMFVSIRSRRRICFSESVDYRLAISRIVDDVVDGQLIVLRLARVGRGAMLRKTNLEV